MNEKELLEKITKELSRIAGVLESELRAIVLALGRLNNTIRSIKEEEKQDGNNGFNDFLSES
jgi:hypothetical protein